MSGNIEKELDFADYEIDKVAELQNKLRAMALEKDAMEKAKDIAVATAAKLLVQVAEAGAPAAVAPGSGKKNIYTEAMHKITHAKVVALTAPALLELKKLENELKKLENIENNYEAIWWCAKHIEALGKGDRPDGYEKYTAWGNKNMTATAIKEYAPLSTEALAAGSP